MNCLFKLVNPIFLSVAVLYSGVVWAFPICAHEWDSAFDGGAFENPLADHSQASNAPEIECVADDHHIEPFADASSPPRMAGFTNGVRLEISSVAGLSLEPNSFWLRSFLGLFAPFQRLSRHLLLSVFRI